MYSICGCGCLWSPWVSKFSINSILFFFQDIFKLVTEEFSSLVICYFYWPWILDHSHSSYQVLNRHCFLDIIFCYFKPPGYGSIIVKYFKIRGSIHFLRILQGFVRSTHSLFHDISSASLVDIYRITILAVLYVGVCHIM